MLTGCSADWHMRKALKKDPSLLTTRIVTVTDTLITPPITVRDTVSFVKMDTVRIEKDKLVIKLVKISDSEFSVDAEVKADTIVRFIEVPIETVIVKEKTFLERVYAFTFWALLPALLITIMILRWLNK
jgi:hypothetical protein